MLCRRQFGRVSEEEVSTTSLRSYSRTSYRGVYSRYVSKIIFTYILGYKVDVGHMEAVNLISSHKYSEKQIVRCPTVSYIAKTHFMKGLPGCDPADA